MPFALFFVCDADVRIFFCGTFFGPKSIVLSKDFDSSQDSQETSLLLLSVLQFDLLIPHSLFVLGARAECLRFCSTDF
jgi:hypothetical protein